MPRITCSVGVSPSYAHRYDDAVEESLREAAKHKQIGALGGCGIEAGGDESQIRAFESQAALARETGLALIVNAGSSATKALEVLKNVGMPKRGVMLRAENAPVEQLIAWAEEGCFISLGCQVASDPLAYCACARSLPAELLLVESGAPEGGIPALAGTSPRCDQVVFVEDALQGIFSPHQLVTNWYELFG